MGLGWSATLPDPSADFDFFRVFFLGGGGVGFALLLPIQILSIVALARIVDHFVRLKRDALVPPAVVGELETLLDEEQYEEALRHCEANRNYVTAVVGASLSRLGEGYPAIREAAAVATDEENVKLLHRISWLSLFGSLGPMLGLFGTVVGMVLAFTDLGRTDVTPSPQNLARGIYTALITTAWGLFAALVSLGFFFYFKLRIQRLSFELSAMAQDIVDRFKPASK